MKGFFSSQSKKVVIPTEARRQLNEVEGPCVFRNLRTFSDAFIRTSQETNYPPPISRPRVSPTNLPSSKTNAPRRHVALTTPRHFSPRYGETR